MKSYTPLAIELSESLRGSIEALSGSDPIARALLRAAACSHLLLRDASSAQYWARRELQKNWPKREAAYRSLVGYKTMLANSIRLWCAPPTANYFTYRDGMISFLPGGRELRLSPEGRWVRRDRQQTTIGRWVNSVLSGAARKKLGGDPAVEKFARALLAHFGHNQCTLKIRTGEEGIDAAYAKAQYILPGHDVPQFPSCMHGRAVGYFYSAAGACCAQLFCGQQAAGRCLIWEVPGADGEPIRIADRLYCPERLSPAFERLLKEQGIWLKVSPSKGWDCREFVSPDGQRTISELKIENFAPFGVTDETFIPYIDTFRFLRADVGEDESTVTGLSGERAHFRSGIVADNQDGTCAELISSDMVLCADGERREESDCHHCADGEWRPEEDCVFVSGCWYAQDDDDVVTLADGEHALAEDCGWCDVTEEYYLTSELRRVRTGRNSYITVFEGEISEL